MIKRLTRDYTVGGSRRYNVFDPAMTIEPGETIVVETINHMTPIVQCEDDVHAHGSPEYQEREETGPIYVNGAFPGDMLAIKIEKIEPVGLPHAHGSGPLVDIYPQNPHAFPIEDGRCNLPGGLSVPLSTMVGDIYTTPVKPSYYDHGGNMDFTEVKPGNVLHLPVFHEGGLLVLGDVHAFQGDGEIFMEGGETAAEVTITVDVNRTYQLKRPMVETKDVYIFLACRETLFDSIRLATEDAVDLTSRLFGVSKEDAYIYCAMAGSLRFGGCLCNKWATERNILVGLSVPKDCRR